MAPVSPTVAQWELTIRLRDRRRELGVSSDAIARSAGFTRTYWSSVENDHNVLTADKLKTVLDVLELGAQEQEELSRLRSAAVARGWWSDHVGLCGDELTRLYGMEHGAASIRTYQNLLMPGLLQCEAYARAVISSDLFVRPAEISQLIEIRMKRQERLSGSDPLKLTAVVSQAALLQLIGGVDVQRTQLRHLATMMRNHPDSIDFRVLPYSAVGRGIFGASTFQLLDFPSVHLPALGWHESVTLRGFIENKTHIRDLDLIFTNALNEALSTDESLALIERTAEGLE